MKPQHRPLQQPHVLPTESPGRIPKTDSPFGSIIYARRVLEYRIGGSICWILPGLWIQEPWNKASEARFLIPRACLGAGSCSSQQRLPRRRGARQAQRVGAGVLGTGGLFWEEALPDVKHATMFFRFLYTGSYRIYVISSSFGRRVWRGAVGGVVEYQSPLSLHCSRVKGRPKQKSWVLKGSYCDTLSSRRKKNTCGSPGLSVQGLLPELEPE